MQGQFSARGWRVTLAGVTTSNPGAFSRFRSLGRSGEPYPAWVDETKGRSGVYAIKHGDVLVYIGESHTDRLYETMTRHFQRWELEGANTYPRSSSTVAVTFTAPNEAPPLQAHRIATMQPRDNVYETGGDSDVPF